MKIQPATETERASLPPSLAEKYKRLRTGLVELESALVAFSGGVDSSLMAYLAHQALGGRVLAVTSGSESLTRADLALTRQLAEEWGMPHRVILTREMERSGYRLNPVDRCYHCKSTLYGDLARIAREEKYHAILNGINRDDWGDHRPGLRAAEEHGVRAPLSDHGLGKAEIRQLAAHLGLPNADKPQAACLSSRVPYGSPISLPVLNQIEQAEAKLRELGFGQLRVRHHGNVARIEVPPEDFQQVLAQRERIDAALRELGYLYVALDLRGFRSGSMNEGR